MEPYAEPQDPQAAVYSVRALDLLAAVHAMIEDLARVSMSSRGSTEKLSEMFRYWPKINRSGHRHRGTRAWARRYAHR